MKKIILFAIATLVALFSFQNSAQAEKNDFPSMEDACRTVGNTSCNLDFNGKNARIECYNRNSYPVTVSWQVWAIPNGEGSRTVIASGIVSCGTGTDRTRYGYWFSTEGYHGCSIEATVQQCQ